MYCPNCGKENPEETLFCSECGTDLNLKNNANNIQQQSIPDKLVIAKAIIFLLGIIAFFILFFKGISLSHLRSVSGDSVAEKFYQGIGNALIAGSLITLSFIISKIITLKKD